MRGAAAHDSSSPPIHDQPNMVEPPQRPRAVSMVDCWSAAVRKATTRSQVPTGTPFNPTPYAQLPLTIMTIVDGSKGGDDVIQSYSLRGARRDIPGWQRGDCAWPNQLDDRNGWLNCR
jgi:hypothetical protein